jgi:hypothetical protein
MCHFPVHLRLAFICVAPLVFCSYHCVNAQDIATAPEVAESILNQSVSPTPVAGDEQQREAKRAQDAKKRAESLRELADRLEIGRGATIADIGAGILDRRSGELLSHREASHRRMIAPDTVEQEMSLYGFRLQPSATVSSAGRFLQVYRKETNGQ